jgi:hypothetical protein
VVGVLVVAAMAVGALGIGGHRTSDDMDWTAPVSQVVTR